MLRFIYEKLERRNRAGAISIHPMLRFIVPQESRIGRKPNFQYIPCYGSKISIHPMLRFITLRLIDKMTSPHFNTSHVTVYLTILLLLTLFIHYFNTSHVTVYQYEIKLTYRKEKFQYIPCYGLSNDFKPFLSWHLSSFPLFYVISTFFTSRL